MDLTITAAKVAQKLGVPITTVWAMATDGTLTPLRHGRRIVGFLVTDINRLHSIRNPSIPPPLSGGI